MDIFTDLLSNQYIYYYIYLLRPPSWPTFFIIWRGPIVPNSRSKKINKDLFVYYLAKICRIKYFLLVREILTK